MPTAAVRQTMVPYGSHQQRAAAPPQYLQHRPLQPLPAAAAAATMMSHQRGGGGQVHLSAVAAAAHQSVLPMSNQLHNLQVMVNNQTSLLRHQSHVSMMTPHSDTTATLMHGKMGHRTAAAQRHVHDAHVYPLPSQPGMIQQTSRPPPAAVAAAGFCDELPTQHGMVRASHTNHESSMMAEHRAAQLSGELLRPPPAAAQLLGRSPLHHQSAAGVVGQRSGQMTLQHASSRHALTAQHSPTPTADNSNMSAALHWHNGAAMIQPCNNGPVMSQPQSSGLHGVVASTGAMLAQPAAPHAQPPHQSTGVRAMVGPLAAASRQLCPQNGTLSLPSAAAAAAAAATDFENCLSLLNDPLMSDDTGYNTRHHMSTGTRPRHACVSGSSYRV